MKINNQYEEAEAIYPVTGLYIDPDGNTMEKAEMLLSEHRMDVYINDVLTMKLVCTPKDLPGLVLGRMVSEGMIHSSEEVEYLYICEHGTRARVQLVSEHCGLVNDNLRAEVMDTPTCCTDNKTIYSGFAVEKELQHLEPVKVSLELMYATKPFIRICHCMRQPGRHTVVFLHIRGRLCIPVRISGVTMHWTKRLVMHLCMTMISMNVQSLRPDVSQSI